MKADSERELLWAFCGMEQLIYVNGFELSQITDFYTNFFTEVSGLGELAEKARYIGFCTDDEQGNQKHFIGVEWYNPATIVPTGFVLYLCYREHLEIWENISGIMQKRERHGIEWCWYEWRSDLFFGEFRISGGKLVQLQALADAQMQKDKQDDVILEPYNPEWPVLYRNIAVELQDRCGKYLKRMEHYGSTSVPDLCAKPVIDILAEVDSFAIARQYILPVLSSEMWEYWWYIDHMIFIRRDRKNGQRDCHLHLAIPNHRLWEGLVFRNALRNHPELAAEYADLKIKLAAENNTDREKYTIEKTGFVRRITDYYSKS